MKWFRMYVGVVHDVKVQRLKPGLFKLWVNLLAIAADNEPRGTLPRVAEIAFLVKLRTDRCQAGIEALTARGLLDATDGGLSPHNWDGRQFESDDVTARVKRYRERHRNADVTPPDTDTDQIRSDKKTLPPAAAACIERFLSTTKANEQVAALIDLASLNGLKLEGGPAAAIVRDHGHGQAVVKALFAYLENRGVGALHEYMLGVLRNAEARQMATVRGEGKQWKEGAQSVEDEGAWDVLTPVEAAERARSPEHEAARSRHGPKPPSKP